MGKFVTVFVFLLLFAVAGMAEINPDSSSRANITIHAFRLTQPVVLDGILSESDWKNDDGFSDFIDRDPVEWVTPSEKTVVHVAYDDAALYIGAMMYDSRPDSIVARLGRKDTDTGSDKLVLFLDPYLDKRSGYEFYVDAAGGLIDGTLYNDEFDSYTWDGVWEGKVQRLENGWSLEMRIPFSQLHFPKNDSQVWGINFRRDIARKNEAACIAFTPKNGSGFVSRFAKLTGIENISPSHQIELLPYVTTQAKYLQHSSGDPFNSGHQYVPATGADLKMGLGSNLTLNATVNPDFGQVEVDPAVVNLSDVETIFQEKRPFFVEGADIFNFGQGGARNFWGFNWNSPNFLYTRRIGRTPQGSLPDNADYTDVPNATHILGAAKLTGKIDDWNLGTIHAVTNREFSRIDQAGVRSDLEVEPLTYYGIARALKEINGGRQGIGILTTVAAREFQDNRLRDQMNSSGSVAALDGWTFLDDEKEWVLTGWGALTHVEGDSARMLALQTNSQHYFQRPDAKDVSIDSSAKSMTGYAARFYLNKQKGNSFSNSAIGIISPKFEINDLGFVSRTNQINMHSGGGYQWTESSWYKYFSLMGALFRSYDFAGNIIWHGLYAEEDWTTPNNFSFNASYAYNPQAVNNRRTRGGPLTISPPGYELYFNSQSNNNASFVLNDYLDWYNASYTKTLSYSITLMYRPAANVSVSFGPEIDRDWENSQWVGAFTDPTAASTYGSRYVYGELNQTTFSASIRLDWTFNPKLSLQLYVQPLVSTGTYTHFKELAQPGTYNFNTYPDSLVSLSSGNYTVDPDGAGGPAQLLQFSNPDFNVRSVRGNAVGIYAGLYNVFRLDAKPERL